MIFQFRRTLLFLIITSILLLQSPPSSATKPPTTTAFDFIRSSCNATLYPDVCYKSLSRYASAVRQDSGKLASVAIAVTLSRARCTAAFFSNLTHSSANSTCDLRTASAVHDCSSLFSDAVSQMRASLSQMRHLIISSSDVGQLRFQLSNVQTWMSAALTNEDTCTDGFDAVDNNWPLKSDVCDRVNKVMKFTSNALALVNIYASSIV